MTVSIESKLLQSREIPPDGSTPSPAGTQRIQELRRRPLWLVYVFAVSVTAATMLVRMKMMVGFGERPLLILFVLPIILSAYAGGIWPGLLSTLLAGAGVNYLLVPPAYAFGFAQAHDLAQWAILIVSGMLISVLTEALHRSRRQAEMSRLLQTVTLASIGNGVITTDIHGCITLLNAEAERLTGWTHQEASGQPLHRVLRIADEVTLQPRADPVDTALTSGAGKIGQAVLIGRDARKNAIEGSVAPIKRADGEMVGVVLAFSDCSEKKKAEAALLESEERFKLLYERAPLAYQSLDENGNFITVNQTWLDLTGYERKEVVGRNFGDFLHPEWVLHFKENFPRFKAVGEVLGVEFEMIKKDGTSILVSFHGRIGRNSEGRFQQTHCIFQNITEQRLAEDALRESEQHFRTLADSGQAMIWTSGVDMMCDYFNRPWLEFTGKSFQQEIGDGWTEGVHPDDLQLCMGIYSSAFERRERFSMVYRLRRRDGEYRWIQDDGTPRYDSHGRFLGYIGHCLDITEQRREQEEREALQTQLHQAQKMEAVGRLAGGVAHDFNNMLGVIIGHTELAMDQIDSPEAVQHDLQEIHKAARRSADLTRQLLAFARKQTVSPRVLDLNDTVSSMIKMLRRLIGEDIDLAWMPGHDLWTVKIDPSQVDQILANLAVNARDAIDGTGRLTIEAANVVFDDSYCTVRPECVPGEYVRLAVSDTGAGMSRDVLEHIFEPFFTTKEVGKGTGLGLATVYGIIKQNEGFVNVYSEPGRGTTFKIHLPRFRGEAAAMQADTDSVKPPGGTETVLIVEDEEAILDLGLRILERLGYTVLTANTPTQAIRLVREYTEDIHLLITDVVMPEMNGRELAEQLSSIKPGMKCLFMSGYTANAIAHHGVLDEGVLFIQKPFSMKEMARKTRMALTS